MEDRAGSDRKFTITCPTHGNFRKTMSNLASNSSGCPACGNAAKGHAKYTTETFIKEANKVHGSFYSYSQATYTNSHTPITITCPAHGEFTTKPYSHLAGHKCRKCAYEDNSISRRMTEAGKPTYLYYVKFPGCDIWKVGCSIDIANRFRDTPYELLFSKKYEDSRAAYFTEAWVLKASVGDCYVGSYLPIQKGRTELRSAPVDIETLVAEAGAAWPEES